MHLIDWSLWGMHALWWLFWCAMVIVALVLLSRSDGDAGLRETPLDILQRRYASGEIGEKEYEERKRTLKRDKPHLVR